MDMNLVLVGGKVAAAPELRTFASGSKLLRVLVAVRTHTPRRRMDVIPVVLWDPDPEHEVIDCAVGSKVWVVGTVQRRFWDGAEDRQSQLEVIATHLTLRPDLAIATSTSS